MIHYSKDGKICACGHVITHGEKFADSWLIVTCEQCVAAALDDTESCEGANSFPE